VKNVNLSDEALLEDFLEIAAAQKATSNLPPMTSRDK
jgi:hypothetical protein